MFGLFIHYDLDSSLKDLTVTTASDPLWTVQDSDDYTYSSGPLARNRDNTHHLKITMTDIGGSVYQIRGVWEDIVNGGDKDYNDFICEDQGVHVSPEPVSMALLGTGWPDWLGSPTGAVSRMARKA